MSLALSHTYQAVRNTAICNWNPNFYPSLLPSKAGENVVEVNIDDLIQRAKIDTKINYKIRNFINISLHLLFNPFYVSSGVFCNVANSMLECYKCLWTDDSQYREIAKSYMKAAAIDLVTSAGWGITYIKVFGIINLPTIATVAMGIFLIMQASSLLDPHRALILRRNCATLAILSRPSTETWAPLEILKTKTYQKVHLEFQKRFAEAIKIRINIRPTEEIYTNNKDFFDKLKIATTEQRVLEAFNFCNWDVITDSDYKKRLHDYKIIAMYHFTNPRLICAQDFYYLQSLRVKYCYSRIHTKQLNALDTLGVKHPKTLLIT